MPFSLYFKDIFLILQIFKILNLIGFWIFLIFFQIFSDMFEIFGNVYKIFLVIRPSFHSSYHQHIFNRLFNNECIYKAFSRTPYLQYLQMK